MSQLKVWVLESISLTLSPVLHLTSCAALDQLLRCSLYTVNKMILSSGDSQPSEMAPTDTRESSGQSDEDQAGANGRIATPLTQPRTGLAHTHTCACTPSMACCRLTFTAF